MVIFARCSQCIYNNVNSFAVGCTVLHMLYCFISPSFFLLFYMLCQHAIGCVKVPHFNSDFCLFLLFTLPSIFQSYDLFFLIFFLPPHPLHREGPRLGVELELQLQAYTTVMATWDPRCICDLHHSLHQCQILNPVSEARDRTHILILVEMTSGP